MRNLAIAWTILVLVACIWLVKSNVLGDPARHTGASISVDVQEGTVIKTFTSLNVLAESRGKFTLRHVVDGNATVQTVERIPVTEVTHMTSWEDRDYFTTGNVSMAPGTWVVTDTDYSPVYFEFTGSSEAIVITDPEDNVRFILFLALLIWVAGLCGLAFVWSIIKPPAPQPYSSFEIGF